MKFPKTIGACIDTLFKMEKKRLVIEKTIDGMREQEKKLEDHILATFKKSDLEGARGKFAVAGIKTSTVPTVEDWSKLYSYIKQHDAFDMLQRRVSATAYRERLEAEEVVPGVKPFTVVKLSITKR